MNAHAMKYIRSGHCACVCHSLKAVDDDDDNSCGTTSAKMSSNDTNTNLGAYTRPNMTTLHQMLHNREWEGIQDAIRKDASVAMRCDDSVLEDYWFDVTRSRKAAQDRDGVNANFIEEIDDVFHGSNNFSSNLGDLREGDTNAPQMQLRYWVGNQTTDTNNLHNDMDANIRAKMQIQQQRTLLHHLCRLHLPSNDALIVQLSHGDSEGLKNLMGAVKTAAMLIKASHNDSTSVGGIGDESSDENAKDEGVAMGCEATKGKFSAHCKDCPCYIYRTYCPPVLLPPVEQAETTDHSANPPKDSNVMVEHKSVLTMTDKMGETPLHSLTSAGSCHIDLIKELVKACRPLDETNSDSDSDSERRPTVRDLLVKQAFHGCTPLHFLAADGTNEEGIRLLLEHCQFHGTTSNDSPHPTVICDSEDDLPLHFASCNGAQPSLLRTLTTSLGDPCSTLARNYRGRLAIDDFIDSYMDSLDEHLDHEGLEESDSTESDDGEESDGADSSVVSGTGSSANQESGIQSLHFKREVYEGDPEYYISSNFGFLSPQTNWEGDLWQPLWVLILAAVAAITNPLNTVQPEREEMQMQNNVTSHLQPLEHPIHAAVIATKYANFPALALVASLLRNDFFDKDINDGEKDYAIQNRSPLLEEDTHGKLPLHWACTFTNEMMHYDGAMGGPINPSTSQCKAIVRWNTKYLPCTMIEYLLHLEPTAAHLPTRQGRLPLHLLLESGNAAMSAHLLEYDTKDGDGDAVIRQPWDDIKLLLKEYPEALGIPDPTSQLYPFLIAAASSNSSPPEPRADLLSLENTYRLIMEDPSLLCQIIEK